MVGDLPFDLIKESGDRSWSLRLVAVLALGIESDIDKVIETLSELDDRRTEQPLLAIVLDPQKPDSARKAASDVLFRIGSYDRKEERAQWWASNDAIVVRHALLMSEPAEAARVTPIAADLSHSLYHEAIRSMEFWEPPEFQKLVIQALDHPNPRVKESAARCLLWEQPVAAERKLLELARDADEEVAIAALDTLIYCSSREILLELDNLRRHGRQCLRDCYETTFHNVQRDFRLAIPTEDTQPDEKAYMLKWLKPINHLLKERRERSRTSNKRTHGEVEPEKPKVTARSIIDDLNEIDGMWYQKEHRYHGVNWIAFCESDQQLLKQFFKQHDDAIVRAMGPKAFAAWQDADAILLSLYDRDVGVLKSSAYNSRFLSANQAIAHRLKELINDPNVMNAFAQEALESYIHHARSSETFDWLLELARTDPRPSIRYISVNGLNSHETKHRVKNLVSILDDPPANTWSLHCAILNGCERSWVSQSTVDYLRSIDNLFLQSELASWIAPP